MTTFFHRGWGVHFNAFRQETTSGFWALLAFRRFWRPSPAVHSLSLVIMFRFRDRAASFQRQQISPRPGSCRRKIEKPVSFFPSLLLFFLFLVPLHLSFLFFFFVSMCCLFFSGSVLFLILLLASFPFHTPQCFPDFFLFCHFPPPPRYSPFFF